MGDMFSCIGIKFWRDIEENFTVGYFGMGILLIRRIERFSVSKRLNVLIVEKVD